MTQQGFLESIRVAVLQGSVNSMQEILTSPPGRSPEKQVVEMSAWYNGLHINDKEIVMRIIAEAIETTIFGFLCVLDGVRAIEDGAEKGRLELYYRKDESSTLLNNSDGDFLHEQW